MSPVRTSPHGLVGCAPSHHVPRPAPGRCAESAPYGASTQPDAPTLDWPALLRAGLQTLRLKPAEFWSLTPAELALMLGLDQRPLPMGRARLLQLSEQYPDRTPA